MKRLTIQLIGATALLLAVSAATQEVTRFDRFRLWNDCAPIDLTIAQLNKDATELGLSREAIETTVRSRLRAARIFDTEGVEYLYVRVSLVGPAHSIKIDFNKMLYDASAETVGLASTWEVSSTGTRPGFRLRHVDSIAAHGQVYRRIPAGERGCLLARSLIESTFNVRPSP